MCQVGSMGLIIIANKEIEVARERDIRSISLCVRLRWRIRTARKNAVLPRRRRHCRRAFCLVNDVELVNAIQLVRAQQGKRTILTGSCVNKPGQDDLARKAVCATRTQ